MCFYLINNVQIQTNQVALALCLSVVAHSPAQTESIPEIFIQNMRI